MEQQIQGQLMSCLYKKCFEKVFTWNYHSHVESYKPLKCLKSETLLKNTGTNGKPTMPPYEFFVKSVDISKKILTLSGYIPPSDKLTNNNSNEEYVKEQNTKVNISTISNSIPINN
jgi:hypothetical protein